MDRRRHNRIRAIVLCCLLVEAAGRVSGGGLPQGVKPFVEMNCVECHDKDMKKGGLDLTALKFDPATTTNFSEWVLVHDRVSKGEMPPKKQAQPEAKAVAAFAGSLGTALADADRSRMAKEGRATQRRLNRYEYENALRDLLHAPWLQVRDSLPEDTESDRFNKSGDALAMSHVQMARYMAAADYALRQVMETQVERPATTVKRYYARDQSSYTKAMHVDAEPERATFPVLGFAGQPDVRKSKAPITSTNAEVRELEGMGVACSAYEPIEPRFNQFNAPFAGHYKLRFNAYSVWVGPGLGRNWYIPNLDNVTNGRRDEPVVIYSDTRPGLLRWQGKFDATPEPAVKELDVWLLAGEQIRPDAGRLFRSRTGAGRWQNPLAEKDGQPGVVFRWLEVEGPIYDEWPTAGQKLLFGDLPVVNRKPATNQIPAAMPNPSKGREREPEMVKGPGIDVISTNPTADAKRLLHEFIRQAYRRPIDDSEVKRFLPVVQSAMKNGDGFGDAMIAAYTAVLCSPEFICLEEKPGRLDDYALASRLSFFLWNTAPDAELRRCADDKRLHQPAVLSAQTERLLADPKSRQFTDAFLDYWLDLRKIVATAPDSGLYNDYYLDDLLSESALEETQTFFADLLHENLPARNIISSDFAMLNERLAAHYGLPPVQGVAVRKTPLPPDSPRGGLLTQAAVLKVTANGTTTSPVLRGAWVMERILGQKPPPPPPGIPAIDPDTRGAVTIRQQLEKHRSDATCAACHAKIDPAGFALESFDVMGGWRTRYRAEGEGTPERGFGKNGQKFAFHYAQDVDPSGQLPDGRKFSDIRELKQLLLADEKQIARNLANQLTVYATGASIHFADREVIEGILQRSAASQYGVKNMVEELVRSDLFLNK